MFIVNFEELLKLLRLLQFFEMLWHNSNNNKNLPPQYCVLTVPLRKLWRWLVLFEWLSAQLETKSCWHFYFQPKIGYEFSPNYKSSRIIHLEYVSLSLALSLSTELSISFLLNRNCRWARRVIIGTNTLEALLFYWIISHHLRRAINYHQEWI